MIILLVIESVFEFDSLSDAHKTDDMAWRVVWGINFSAPLTDVQLQEMSSVDAVN